MSDEETQTEMQAPVEQEAPPIRADIPPAEQPREPTQDEAATTFADRLAGVYAERNKCVALLVHLSRELNYHAGIGLEQSSDHRFAAIDLPTGQVSWYIEEDELPWFAGVPLYDKALEEISEDEKYQRVLAAGL